MNTVSAVTRKPFFWALAAALGIASIAFTHKYFSKAMPVISLSITMDRAQAVATAEKLSVQHNWLPSESQSAVMFESDTFLQFFVELECGGKQAFQEILSSHIFEPYVWHVRHFKEKVTEETHVFFTPEGVPYGFIQKLPETFYLPNSTVEEARTLAQHEARAYWNVSFEPYAEIEVSKDEKPCGRVDHTFVYQRNDAQLGTEGFYRLKIVVSGNKVTQVSRFVFIPETFKRRYEQMRSSNSVVSTCGRIGLMFLYIILGCLGGGLYFFRKRVLIYKPALTWAAFIAILLLVASFNRHPFMWMHYDTATSSASFLLQQLLFALLGSIVMGIFLSLIFTVGITWDRIAFPDRLAFWKLWSQESASSPSVLGQTIGGYAYAVIFTGLAMATYIILTSLPGWWSPADTLSNPNILATYLPWLDAAVMSLQAGFWEEVAFRALPLAAAALIGRYYKKEGFFVAIAFVLQACIFAACHADYVQQPSYFRLVELLIPSFNFALLYLLFGLLPGIIAHFLYDLFCMSLPIWASHGTHATISKLFLCTIGLIPLAVVLYRRRQQGSWLTPAVTQYNSADLTQLQETKLPMQNETPVFDTPEQIVSEEVSPITHKRMLIAGVIGLLLMGIFGRFKPDAPCLTTTKAEALCSAQTELETQNFEVPADFTWQPLMFIASLPTNEEKFVWQTQNKDLYQSLVGSYITPPSWAVRYVSFTGNLIARTQEFICLIGPDNKLIRTRLILPESKPGASLSQGEARGIALKALEEYLGITPNDIKEISAIAQELPARKDWTFTFQDTRIALQQDGQARISVLLAGDRVVNVRQFVFVPEQWLRNQQQHDVHRGLIAALFVLLKTLAVVGAAFAVRRRFFTTLDVKAAMYWTVGLIGASVFTLWNTSSQFIALSAITSQPLISQLFTFMSSQLVFVVLIGIGIAFLASQINTLCQGTCSWSSAKKAAALGVSTQLFITGIIQTILYFLPRYMPYIPNYIPMNSHSTFLDVLVGAVQPVILSACIPLIVVKAAAVITNEWTKDTYKGWTLLILFLIGDSFVANLYMQSAILIAVICGLLTACMYYLIFRKDPSGLLMTGATQVTCLILWNGIAHPYPQAFLHSLVVAIVIFGATFYWLLLIKKPVLKS